MLTQPTSWQCFIVIKGVRIMINCLNFPSGPGKAVKMCGKNTVNIK